MKRLLITGPKKAEFADAPLPGCPSNGVLVKAKVTAISAGTEVRVYRGIAVDDDGKFMHETKPYELPCENGYSMVGEVVEVGKKRQGPCRRPARLRSRAPQGIRRSRGRSRCPAPPRRSRTKKP